MKKETWIDVFDKKINDFLRENYQSWQLDTQDVTHLRLYKTFWVNSKGGKVGKITFMCYKVFPKFDVLEHKKV